MYVEFDDKHAQRYLDEKLKIVAQNEISILHDAGMTAVREARISGNYQDRTAHLRNSVGYVIQRDGQRVHTELPSAEGAQERLQEISQESPTPEHAELTVVAGMEYAAYVEAKGYNVLSTAEIEAKKVVEQFLKGLLK